jgi:hypothetical protein
MTLDKQKDTIQGAPAGDHAPQQQQYSPQGQGYPPQNQQYQPQGQGYPQQQQQQHPYGQGPPPVGPPAPMGAPPPMPPGWIQQWDQNSQRWYYVEQATGRTQWDPPAHLPPGPYAPPPTGAPYQAPSGHNERALFGNTQGHQGHDYTPTGAATNEKEKSKDKEKSKGHSTAMLAAAGVGGIAAGAWIGHELSACSTLVYVVIQTNKKQPKTTKSPPRQAMLPRLVLATERPHPCTVVHHRQIPTQALRTRRQFPRTTGMARPSQVAIASRSKRSARI